MSAFDGIDLDGVKRELARYVEETTPRNQSTANFITASSAPACGRARALEYTERVRPILDQLYPAWREENEQSSHFEFQSERDACQRLTSQIESRDEIRRMLGGDPLQGPRFAARQLHELVWKAASAQWATGHRHEAVLAAAKIVNSMLQKKLLRHDISDVQLVREAYSEKEPSEGHPRLRYPMIEDAQTRESMRQGVSGFGAGCFQAIRNPVSHLPNEDHELTEQEALERLAAFSLLARWIEEATVESVP